MKKVKNSLFNFLGVGLWKMWRAFIQELGALTPENLVGIWCWRAYPIIDECLKKIASETWQTQSSSKVGVMLQVVPALWDESTGSSCLVSRNLTVRAPAVLWKIVLPREKNKQEVMTKTKSILWHNECADLYIHIIL